MYLKVITLLSHALWDRYTYLPAWKKLVETDTVSGVMSAISGLNGIPSAAHKELLTGMCSAVHVYAARDDRKNAG